MQQTQLSQNSSLTSYLGSFLPHLLLNLKVAFKSAKMLLKSATAGPWKRLAYRAPPK